MVSHQLAAWRFKSSDDLVVGKECVHVMGVACIVVCFQGLVSVQILAPT